MLWFLDTCWVSYKSVSMDFFSQSFGTIVPRTCAICFLFNKCHCTYNVLTNAGNNFQLLIYLTCSIIIINSNHKSGILVMLTREDFQSTFPLIAEQLLLDWPSSNISWIIPGFTVCSEYGGAGERRYFMTENCKVQGLHKPQQNSIKFPLNQRLMSSLLCS